MNEKPDAALIRQHIDSLKHADWIDAARSWWPDYLFHFTDVNNVVQILKTGYLMSRERIKLTNETFIDVASPKILETTSDKWKKYVRLYFRPKTPMLYNNEGIRPQKTRQLDAHCPIPVYLLFDSKAILSMNESLFTSGNLARASTKIFSSAEDFRKLPFQSIYHDERITDDMDKAEITNRRHSEVIVPDQIGLTHLKHIWCRSEAEYDMLCHLLGRDWRHWANKITKRTDRSLFNRLWTYIDRVVLDAQGVDIYFHEAIGRLNQGPFDIRVEITSEAGLSPQPYVVDNILNKRGR